MARISSFDPDLEVPAIAASRIVAPRIVRTHSVAWRRGRSLSAAATEVKRLLIGTFASLIDDGVLSGDLVVDAPNARRRPRRVEHGPPAGRRR